MTVNAPRHGFEQARGFRVTVVLAVKLAALALALLFSGLLNRAAASHARQRQAAEVMNGIRTIDGIEWRAVAGVDMAEMSPALHDATEDVERILAEGEGLDDVAAAFGAFAAALNDEFDALEAGDWATANAIDEERVDPAFEQVMSLATDAVTRETASAQRTETLVRRLIWLSTGSSALVLAVVLSVVFTARDRMREKDVVAVQGRRFQSLVESSADVITVVSGDDELTVMSATLGGLGAFATRPRPGRVDELLPAHALASWRAADDQLRSSGTPRSLAISLSGVDGSAAHFEAHGSRLVDSPTERVWVWRDVTERQHLERELSHQAFHDPLTGLANRALFRDRTEHALGRGGRSALPTAVLFIDLDDFKTVNDSLGHAAGDELLNVIASRMRACVRPSDTLARLGGDEFAVLLEDTDEPTARHVKRLTPAAARSIDRGPGRPDAARHRSRPAPAGARGHRRLPAR